MGCFKQGIRNSIRNSIGYLFHVGHSTIGNVWHGLCTLTTSLPTSNDHQFNVEFMHMRLNGKLLPVPTSSIPNSVTTLHWPLIFSRIKIASGNLVIHILQKYRDFLGVRVPKLIKRISQIIKIGNLSPPVPGG